MVLISRKLKYFYLLHNHIFYKGRIKMSDLECFKDTIFDLLNEADSLAIKDVEINDKENRFQVFLENGNVFELKSELF